MYMYIKTKNLINKRLDVYKVLNISILILFFIQTFIFKVIKP